MTATMEDATCPKCGGPMFDNRLTKRNPKAPDYKCRDRGCDGVIWPPKGNAAPRAAAPAAKQPYSSGGPIPGVDDVETGAPPAGSVFPRLDNLLTVYEVCFDKAHSLAHRTYGKDESHEATAAMAATMLIAAKDMGLVR